MNYEKIGKFLMEERKKLNLTQVMVSRYEKRSIDKMRSFIAS